MSNPIKTIANTPHRVKVTVVQDVHNLVWILVTLVAFAMHAKLNATLIV